MTQIDVKSYLSIHQFLQDVYQSLKKEGDFSYEIWAQELGVSSKSYLRFAILGQRKVSEALAQKMCQFFNFNDVDREYFLLLVLYTQSANESQKRFYGKKLTQLLRKNVLVEDIAPPDAFLANPLCVVIRNLLSFSDIPGTVESLAQLLSVSKDEVLRLLRVLEEAEMVVQTNGQWSAVHEIVRVKDKPADTALLSYHRTCLEKAIAAQETPPKQRHYRALNVAFTEDEYVDYLQDLSNFATEVFAKYNKGEIANRRLYQLNFNAFPWTEPVVLKK